MCVCTDESIESNENNESVVESFKEMVKSLVVRNQVLETLSGINVHALVVEKCIVIQRWVRRSLVLKKITGVRKRVAAKVIKRNFQQYLLLIEAFKTEHSKEIVKNCLRTSYHRKRFKKIKASAILVQKVFRKSLTNVSYSSKCELVREVSYLQNKVASREFIIYELKKKIRRLQSQNSKTSSCWYKKNILDSIINTIDVP